MEDDEDGQGRRTDGQEAEDLCDAGELIDERGDEGNEDPVEPSQRPSGLPGGVQPTLEVVHRPSNVFEPH